jgi:hypothetical protein
MKADSVESELPREPHLSFTESAWRRLRLYTTRCPYEIGGLGTVAQAGEDFVVEEVFVLDQDVNDIATRLEPESVHGLLLSIVADGGDPSALRLWWHSHARESVFWSGEDEETIDRFQNDGMLSVVTNHRGQVLARIDVYRPRGTTWLWVDEGEDVVPTEQEEQTIDDDIRAKTRHRPRGSARIF